MNEIPLETTLVRVGVVKFLLHADSDRKSGRTIGPFTSEIMLQLKEEYDCHEARLPTENDTNMESGILDTKNYDFGCRGK